MTSTIIVFPEKRSHHSIFVHGMSEIRDISLGENRKRFRQFFAIYFAATALIEIQRDYFAVVSGKNTVVNIYRNIERARGLSDVSPL